MHYLFLLICFFLGSCSEEIKITKVVVWSPELEVLSALENSAELEEFEKHIYGLVPVDYLPFPSPTENALYKIDIESTNEKFSGRWLYHKGGYLVRLSKNLQPRYKVRDVKKFESVVGI